jgi:acyl-CoA thioesterase-1
MPSFMEPLDRRELLSAFSAHINFQPPGPKAPKTYLPDTGAAFATQRGTLRYGWSTKNPTEARRHSKLSPDLLHDTVASFVSGKKRLVWEMKVPNGVYIVHIVAGDPARSGDLYRLKAENTLVINAATSGKARWVEGTAQVVVKDGILSVAMAPSSTGTEIDSIDLSSAPDPTPAPPPAPSPGTFAITLEAEAADSASGVTNSGNVVSSLDNGDYVEFNAVDLSQGFRSIQARLGTSSANDAQSIEIRADAADGPLLGTLHTEGFGPVESFITQSTSITIPPELMGRHNLYCVFKGSAPVGDLDWLRLSQRKFYTIMPMGDSITEGKGGHDTYRRPLWKMLEDGGYSVNFEGTHRGLVQYAIFNQTEWDWDQDHEGHTGYRAHDIVEHMDEWFAAEPAPDIVLLHIGLNDIVMDGTRPEQIIVSVGQIIDKLRQYNPNITVLLAQTIPCARTTYQEVQWYGVLVAQLAAEKNTTQSPIILVDQFDGFDAVTETYDGMHPTPEGEVKVAGKWMDALKGVL